MIECIFTIDYEIYGNGEGSLKELVYDPAQQLKAIFDRIGAKFVVFVEAAEFEKIEAFCSDSGIEDVNRQIRELHEHGYEIGLHLHPQWCNARRQNGKWVLDYSEYNLCTLNPERIAEIVAGAIAYLRKVLGKPDFAPLSFRAGNWLLQPTQKVAEVLARNGIKIDSSVFRGGLQQQYGLDYRSAPAGSAWWRFLEDAATPDPAGLLLEVPIYTQPAPFWRMATRKRIGLQRKSSSGPRPISQRFYRWLDLMRWSQPLKFDFCRMTLKELIAITERALREAEKCGAGCRPMVAIGHSKDLVDFETIEAYLEYLRGRGIHISGFEDIYLECGGESKNQPSEFIVSSSQT
jgi:hypothetical protein